MKTALVVIDMQNDYLWERRKKTFPYDTGALVGAVNGLIRQYAPDVIYVRHIIHAFPTNRLLFGYSIAGTEGAELYSGLERVPAPCFDKYFSDALTCGRLRDYIREKGYDTLRLCGLDEYGCVAETALGAARRGIRAEIVRAGTATVLNEKKAAAMRERLSTAGIQYV